MIDEEPSQLVIEEDAEPQHSPSSSESVDSKEDPSHTCKFCGMVFEHRTPFSLHLNDLHSDRPLYRCPQCPLVFAVKRDLSTHFRVHSGESPHECIQCGKQLLKKHTMWHTGELTDVCPHCGKAFYQKGNLTQHVMIHAGGRPHVCNLCSKTFIFKFDLNRHMKIHTERGHSCKKCNRSFLKQTSLDDQLIKCKGLLQRTFTCTPSTPTNLSVQSLHMPLPLTPSSTLLANPLYSCMLCGQPNDSKDDLAVHLAVAHFPDAPRPPQMTSPVKQESVDSPLFLGLPTPTKLSDGLSAFFPIKNEEVPTIDTATNSSASSPQKASSMGSASSPSMEEGDASDETLLLSFASSSKIAQMEARKGHLTQHLMIHAGGRPHVCNLCSKTFIFKFDLNRHMKIHMERGHSCQKCNCSFLKQTSLDDHLIKCKGLLQKNFTFIPSTPTNLSVQSLQMPGSSTSCATSLLRASRLMLEPTKKDDLLMSLTPLTSTPCPIAPL